MSEIAIQVEGLGKLYKIGKRQQYQSMRDTIAELFYAPFRKARGLFAPKQQSSLSDDMIWALKDVSFEVKQGEVVGVIGRNGAGKSTLLKILSRITEPTKGKVEIHGRIGSLLEVGTGFHPELTGRENVYFNGSILGMKKSEIEMRFDDIVSFSETEQFIDTPVKHYSSGMQMRLAFSVAAHLDPEMLLVDEVLAVGDAEFQRKCLGKMREAGSSGRTVLFVSHNLGAVQALCGRAIWLAKGEVKCDGAPSAVIGKYLSSGEEWAARRSIQESQRRAGSGELRIVTASVHGLDGIERTAYMIGEPFELELDYETHRPARGTFFLLISNVEGRTIFSGFESDGGEPREFSCRGRVVVRIEHLGLLPGDYFFSAGIFDHHRAFVDWAESLLKIEVLARFADGRVWDHRLGDFTRKLEWRHEATEMQEASIQVKVL